MFIQTVRAIPPARATISSISSIARRAKVTRATVYRHFPDDESLFLACSGQWLCRQQLPDPDSWGSDDDPFAVLHAGLTDIYHYFHDGEPMLDSVLRDPAFVSVRVTRARLAREREWLDRLTRALPSRRRKTVRAAVAHAMSFDTWRSLCADQGLSSTSVVGLMVATIAAADAAAEVRSRPRGTRRALG